MSLMSPFALLVLLLAPSFRDAPQEEASDPRGKAIEAIEKAGGRAHPVAQGLEAWIVNFSIHGKEATDDVLIHLRALGSIEELSLARTQVTDAGLASVAGLPGLNRLDLHATAVGDAGLKHLAAAEGLVVLNLYGTRVTDEGLTHLARLQGLRRLYVWGSAVTREGAQALEALLPELDIDGGWDSLAPQPAEEIQTCCTVAKAAGKACAHPCCVAAAGVARTCFLCNPTLASTCCEKAEAAGASCEHACCVQARAQGGLCLACNPPAPPEPDPKPAPDPEPKPPAPEKGPLFKDGSCCDTAAKAGSSCAHSCCVAAGQAGEVCAKCN
jgi:hypothetical protein